MQKSVNHPQKVSSLKRLSPQSIRRMSGRRSHVATSLQSSPTVFPEKRGKLKSSRQANANVAGEGPEIVKTVEHKIEIGEEHSDLLGYEVYSGKLSPYKKSKATNSDTGPSTTEGFDAKLTSKALTWGSHILHLEDVVSVSYNNGVRHFTVHAYPVKKRSCVSCFTKPQRTRQDYCFLASSTEEAIQWISGFADQHCFVKFLPHPMVSSKKQATEVAASEPLFAQPYIRCRTPPKVLVILNPRSGHGRSSKVFHGKVEPIFELAGFEMEVVKTTSAGHAKTLASTVDFSACPDGIVCVGGDGIVNEVLNGLLSRQNQKEAISIPIGIIPTGSDNSLVWTVLGVRDPISAAMNIVNGGLTQMDVFAVEWIQTGAIHFGTTVTYFGFVSDVLELSEKYQKRFGPLRYFIAGFLKFLCLPKYSFEVEYLPMSKEGSATEEVPGDHDKLHNSSGYTDSTRKLNTEGIPRASSLSSIDSLMSPSRMSGAEFDTSGSTIASSEPSNYVRGLDPKAKRLSLGRNNVVSEPEEVVHPQPRLSSTPNWPRTRSKSRTDKGWSGLNTTSDTRPSWVNDKEDISSTISDPGPIWDSEPKWDAEPRWDPEQNWETEDPVNLPGPPQDIEMGLKFEPVPNMDERWTVKKGKFLGILVCNHSCKTVQSLSSQIVAPKAVHDDNNLDVLLVHGSGRWRLLRFFLHLQCGRHLSLPYVEYVKVKSVKIKPGKITHNGCGIDGELLQVSGQVMCSLLPEQCSLIGRPARAHL